MPISRSEFQKGKTPTPRKFRRGLKEEIIRFLQEQTENGFAVSIRDICQGVGTENGNYVRQVIRKLMEQGLVEGRVLKFKGRPPTTYYIWVGEQN